MIEINTRRARLLLGLAIPAVLIVIWAYLGRDWAGDVRYATPSGVGRGLFDLAKSGDLYVATKATLIHVALGFALGTLLGTIIGLLAGYSIAADSWLGPLIHTLRSVAPFAWIPVTILWFGLGNLSVVLIIGYAAFFPVALNVMSGAAESPTRLIDAARVLGASRSSITLKVMLPAVLPSLLTGARLSMGAAWISVVAAELASASQGPSGASGGLGNMMFTFYAFDLNLNNIVGCIACIGILAFCTNALLEMVYRKITPWETRSVIS